MTNSDAWSRTPLSPVRLDPLPGPDPSTSKRDRGTVVIVAGGLGCPGSAILSATSALRAGAGRVQIITEATHASLVAVTVPETLVIGCVSHNGRWRVDAPALDALHAADVVLVGPGLTSEGPDLAETVLGEASPDAAILFDAAALSGLPPGPLRDGCAILPNPDEVPFIAAGEPPCPTDAEQMADAAINLACQTDAVAVVRGAVTAVADSDTHVVRILDDPCPGLSIPGSGDVLGGIVAGCRTRQHRLAEAASWGVLVHHGAGRLLEETVGSVGFLARDICDHIPVALRQLTP